jgi:hypothetical protein
MEKAWRHVWQWWTMPTTENWVAAVTERQITFKLYCCKSLVKLVKVNHASPHLPDPHYILFFLFCGFVLCMLLLLSSHLLTVMGVQYWNWRVISVITWLLLSLNTSIYLWLYRPLLGLGRFFSFFISYAVGRTPWTGDQSVARPLSAHRTAQTQNKHTQTSMPQVGFELTIPVFERAKTVHTLGRATTVIGKP